MSGKNPCRALILSVVDVIMAALRLFYFDFYSFANGREAEVRGGGMCMGRRARWIAETAAMTALLIAFQGLTKAAGQYVTGSFVNAVLGVAVLVAGLGSGVVVAALSPFFAFLLGIGPQLLPIVPAIAVGNLTFVVLLWLIAGKRSGNPWRQAAAWLMAAAGKFAALYLLVVKLLCSVLPLQQTQIDTFTMMFSYPQLVTALVGGALALLLAPVLRRALKR